MKDPKLDLLTPENSQVIFIDHQPQMAFGVSSIDRQILKNNTVALAKLAQVFGVPTAITAVETEAFSGHTYPGLLSVWVLADMAALSTVYMHVPQKDIPSVVPILNILSGKISHASGTFSNMAPPVPPASPTGSPVNHEPGPGEGQNHKVAWANPIPVTDRSKPAFRGARGCAYFAVQEGMVSHTIIPASKRCALAAQLQLAWLRMPRQTESRLIQ